MQVRSRGSLVKVLFGFAFFVSVIMHGARTGSGLVRGNNRGQACQQFGNYPRKAQGG